LTTPIFGAVLGLFIGIFFGSSIGVASGGNAVNGVYIFGPIGGFVGWLIAKKTNRANNRPSVEESQADADIQSRNNFPTTYENQAIGLLHSSISFVIQFLADVWNFKMDIILKIGLMPTLKSHSWVFVVFPFVITFIIPFYAPIYVLLGVVAMSCGANAENNFRAIPSDSSKL
jgi:hypothetical protein